VAPRDREHDGDRNDLEAFERRLYAWAVASGYSVQTVEQRIDREIDMLCREYKAFNERNNLSLGSADDHHHDDSLTAEQLEWVRDFSTRWENSAPVHTNKGVVPGRMA
jgi:transposase